MDKETSVILRNKKDSKRIRQCRVVFSYKQDHEDELNLNVGDVIEILGEEEEGWWRGILNGKIGVFPSNFVEEIFEKLKSSKEDLHSPHENEIIQPSKPAKILCEVKYSYKAQNEDELSMKEGDIITLLSKDGQDAGWWKGEMNGVVGVFPDNFVTILPHNNNVTDKNSNEKSLNTDSSSIKPSSVASHRKSLDIKNLTNNVNEKVETNHSDSNKITPPVPSKKPAIIGIKKSPSGGSGVGSSIFSGIKKKIVDAVDGATSSKTKTVENNESTNENIFDMVERVPLLTDVRATRAKAPAGRRPPSVVFREDEAGMPNGNSVEPLNLEVVTEQSTDTDGAEVKPKLREWEKHKAPWLAEMKMNQAKRTSPSPVHPPTDSKPKTPEIEEVKQKTPEMESIPNSVPKTTASSTPLSSKPREINEKVPLRPKPNLTNIPTPRPSSMQQQQPTSPVVDIPQKPTKIVSPSSIKNEKNPESDITISFKQYTELVERIHKLELLIEKQNTIHTAAIDELKGKLQLETQIRQMLQVQLDKIASQNLMQV